MVEFWNLDRGMAMIGNGFPRVFIDIRTLLMYKYSKTNSIYVGNENCVDSIFRVPINLYRGGEVE